MEAARAALAQTAWDIAQKTRQASEDALVADTFFEPGEWVPAGRPVVSLLPPGNLKVRFYVPEGALSTLSVGEQLELRCDHCPADLRVNCGGNDPALRIGGVEVHEVAFSTVRDSPYDLLYKISMRVKESHAIALRNILISRRRALLTVSR